MKNSFILIGFIVFIILLYVFLKKVSFFGAGTACTVFACGVNTTISTPRVINGTSYFVLDTATYQTNLNEGINLSTTNKMGDLDKQLVSLNKSNYALYDTFYKNKKNQSNYTLYKSKVDEKNNDLKNNNLTTKFKINYIPA